MILSVVSLKGGVGKTTTCMHLAAVAAEQGLKAVVLDGDEERSALEWARLAGNLPFEVRPAERDRIARQARELIGQGLTVLIDTPPNNRDVLTRAASVAATCLVPLPPTGLDVNRMVATLELLRDVEASRGGLDAVLLLTRWDGRKRLAREALGVLAELPLLESRVRDLARYQDAFGSEPSYLTEYRSVWFEVTSVKEGA
jgi:chromosome partitioning protein